ncbi:hypothetical protein TTHERM_000624539 (macronuclear) [Tetrahymena thermophila SB210]|uniref:Uncharacterized protein n=1 Tax=Tetrahymena thermophila (strain SB210) TaxID=312017 RepID=W7X0M6_TETTS|nr:hypothetical protein TTHERM_000624539 [Tetrahymena thermophila SB210]EWS72700.1 hypothetical protein TTHERM_000624539 [Tetrahymena thermophila SB210]|eukprot:XP_012654776.1 hypothetical protein TTHERM_000624539 [Tetrahymena thermophila SB210]
MQAYQQERCSVEKNFELQAIQANLQQTITLYYSDRILQVSVVFILPLCSREIKLITCQIQNNNKASNLILIIVEQYSVQGAVKAKHFLGFKLRIMTQLLTLVAQSKYFLFQKYFQQIKILLNLQLFIVQFANTLSNCTIHRHSDSRELAILTHNDIVKRQQSDRWEKGRGGEKIFQNFTYENLRIIIQKINKVVGQILFRMVENKQITQCD